MADAQIKVGIKADGSQFVAGAKKTEEAIDKLKKKAEEYNKGFEDAAKQSQKEIDHLTARLEKAGGSTDSFGSILKSVTGGAVAGFVSGLISADAVVAGFQKAITSTQATADAWDKMMSGMRYSTDYFFQSLSEGSFDGFIEGLNIAISKGRELAEQLDNIGDMTWAKDFRQNELELQIEKAKQIINSNKSTPEQKQKANEEVKVLQKEFKSYTERLSKDQQTAAITMMSAATGMKITEKDLHDYIRSQEHDPNDPFWKYVDRKASVQSANTSTSYGYMGTAGVMMPMGTTVSANGEEQLKKMANPAFDRLEKIINRISDGKNGEREKIAELIHTSQRNQVEASRYETQGVRLDNRATRSRTITSARTSSVKADFWDSVPAPDAKALGLDKPMIAPIRPALVVAPEVIKRLEDERRSLVEQLNATVDPDARIKLKSEISGVEGKLGQVKELVNVDGIKFPEPPNEDAWQFDGLDQAINAFGELANVMDLVTGSSDNALSSILRWGAGVVSAIGQAIPSIVALTTASKAKATAHSQEAVAGAAASKSAIPLVGPLMAVASVASVVAAIASAPKFAGGGIVPGVSFSGDKVLARLNSGEMVLNQEQQVRLFSKLDRSDQIGWGEVEFKIKGEELVGVLDRFGRRSSRT